MMAKRLSAQDRVLRFRSEGLTDKQIGKAIGRSERTVRRYGSGKVGARAEKAVLPALREFAGLSGKRKASAVAGQTKLEKALAPVVRLPDPLREAKGQLADLGETTDKVVFYLTNDKGQTIMLGSKGGLDIDQISQRNMKKYISEQYGRQYRQRSKLDFSTVRVEVGAYYG